MIQIINRIPCRLSRSLLNSTLRQNVACSAFSLANRQRSTNQSKKSTQNIQQAALKLDPAQECPPNPKTSVAAEPVLESQGSSSASPGTSPSSASSSSSSSSPPPPEQKSDNTKWILIAGAIAAGAGFLMYQNSKGGSDGAAPAQANSKKPTKPEKFRSPQTTENIPKHVPYLLIGGGTASFAAFRAIKSNEPKAKILVISNEEVMPYMRPPLSKEIWFDSQLGLEQARFKQWNGAERSLYYEPEEFYMSAEKLGDANNGGVSVIRGYSVTKLNVNEQKVVLDDGTELTYDKCLIATGSVPKTVDVFDRAPAKVRERIHSYKSIKDFETVKGHVEKSKNIAVVGNGFLGSELACALAHYGQNGRLKVYQVFAENGNMAKVLPDYLSKWTTERIREVGVDILPNSQIIDVESYEGNQVRLKLANGKTIVVDHVIQAVGSKPNVNLAKDATLEVDPILGGLVVNAELEARSNLYAAGDVACFYDPKLGRRRVEHHDHAVVSGRLAGENMVGLKKPYKHQSMFWSDLGTAVGYEAIGIIDASLPTVAVFAKQDESTTASETKTENEKSQVKAVEKPVEIAEPMPVVIAEGNSAENPQKTKSSKPATPDDFDKGVLFYMKGDKIVGILLWNVFNRISIARKILTSDETFKDLNEVAKLFDIFDQQQDKQN